MSWLVLFGSTFVYTVIGSAGLVRVVPAQWLPNLALLWIYALADRTPQTAARANDVWLSGFAAAAALGYMTDVFLVAPRGLHAALYLITFVLVRITTDRLAQAHPLRLFFTLGAATFLVQLAVWWTKALTQQFVTLSALDPTAFAVHAVMTALFGVPFFSVLCRVLDPSEQSLR